MTTSHGLPACCLRPASNALTGYGSTHNASTGEANPSPLKGSSNEAESEKDEEKL